MPNPTDRAETRPSSAPSLLAAAVILLGIFVMPISIAGTAVALPDIAAALGSDSAALQGVVNAFNVALTLGTLIWGQLALRLGAKVTFLAGLGTVVVGSGLSALAPTLIFLDAARALTGFGAAALATGGTTVLSHAYTGARRARVFAWLGTVVGVGLALGPALCGLLVAALGWRGTFAAAAIWAGAVLVLAGTSHLPAPGTIRGASAPWLDLSAFRSKRFTAIVLVPVAGSFAYVSVLTYLPVAVGAVYGMSPAAAGLFMLPLTLPVLAGPMLAATLMRRRPRTSSTHVIAASLGLLIAGDLAFLVVSPSVHPAWLVVPMLALGFGWGLPLGLVDGEALAAVARERAAAAAGALNFLRLGSEALAVAAFAAVIGGLLTARLGNASLADAVFSGEAGRGADYAAAFRLAMMAAAALTAAVAVAVALLLRRSHRQNAAPPAVSTVADSTADLALEEHLEHELERALDSGQSPQTAPTQEARR